MAKPRVHELAKELGITSKEAISKLQELGEFVRGASSTVEPPVAKKLRSAYPAGGDSAAQSKNSAGSNSGKPAQQGARKPAEKSSAPKPGGRVQSKPAGSDAAVKPAAGSAAPTPGAPKAPAKPVSEHQASETPVAKLSLIHI